MICRGWLLLVLCWFCSGPAGRAQSAWFEDDFESAGASVDASRWPGNIKGYIYDSPPFFGASNRYLKILGATVKVLSGDWARKLTNAVNTFAFDYYEATNSTTSLILGFAAGTSDINTDGAFARLALTGGAITYGGAEGTLVTTSGKLNYPRSSRLTFSLVLNDLATPQPFNGATVPAKSMEVWYWDGSSGQAVFVMRISTTDSIRKPVAFGFRTWSTSTGVEAYVDNVKLIAGGMLVINGEADFQPPEERILPPWPFVHPSVLNTQQDLDRIKYRISRQSGLAVHAGWNQLRSASVASLAYQHVPYSNVVVMGSGSTPSENQFRNDAHAARAAALQWIFTGDARYKTKALSIMNDWANTFVTMSPASGTSTAQIELEAAWAAPIWVSAADLVRYYNDGAAGWGTAEIVKFDSLLGYLYTQAAKAATRLNNWGASAALTMIAVGAYQENRPRFEAGVKAWRDGLTGINSAVGYNGYINEVCRDTIHPQYTPQVWMQAAEIAWKHGLDLFGTTFTGSNAPQFAINLENFSRLFTGLAQPPCSSSFLTNYNYLGEQSHSGAYDIAYNHYLHRQALTSVLPVYSRMITNGWRPGGWDGHFCSWSTLTHGDLSSGIPGLQPLQVTNTFLPGNATPIVDGDTFYFHQFHSNAVRVFTIGNSNTSFVQFYTNGVAFGGPDLSPPFVSGDLPVGNYFVSAIPNQSASGGVIPGDPLMRFLRVLQVPPPWKLYDIGSPPEPAIAGLANDNLLLRSAGTNLFGAADQLSFLATHDCGDGQLTARLADSPGVAGLMLRDSLAPGSRLVALMFHQSLGKAMLSARTTGNGVVADLFLTHAASQPWLRLTRLGSNVSAYVSSDGVNWRTPGAAGWVAGSNSLAGFAAISTGKPAAAIRFEGCRFEPLTTDYNRWQSWTLIHRGATNAASIGRTGDPDDDGRSNEWEFRLGSDPLTADRHNVLTPGALAPGFIRLRVRERVNAAAFGRLCMVSTDLAAWAAITPVQEAVLEDNGGTVLRELTLPVTEPAGYYRITYPAD